MAELEYPQKGLYPPDHHLTTADVRVLQSVEEKAQLFASASTTAELPMAQQQLGREGEEVMDLSPPSGQDEPLTHFQLTRALRGVRSTKSSPGGDRITYPLLKKLQAPTCKRFWHSSTSARGKGQSPRPGQIPSSYQSPRPTSLRG